jgi:hypothetical protein
MVVDVTIPHLLVIGRQKPCVERLRNRGQLRVGIVIGAFVSIV